MTRLTPLYSSLKAFQITYQTPQETLLTTPETLPTAEPATPQISYTVADADLPDISIQPESKMLIGVVIGAGQFTTAGTLYWKMLKNGSAVNDGSFSVSANYYYTINAYFLDVAVGDTLELSLWSSVSDSVWDYKAYQIQITRFKVLGNFRLEYKTASAQPALTEGNPSALATRPSRFCFDRASDYGQEISPPQTWDVYRSHETYGMYRLHYGDRIYANGVSTYTHPTYRPVYIRNECPTLFHIRFLNLEMGV
ncbi:hypothetical protein J7J18_03750 [bacterium]|nr:hypothetical protein [bacterium]